MWEGWAFSSLLSRKPTFFALLLRTKRSTSHAAGLTISPLSSAVYITCYILHERILWEKRVERQIRWMNIICPWCACPIKVYSCGHHQRRCIEATGCKRPSATCLNKYSFLARLGKSCRRTTKKHPWSLCR